MSPRAAAIVLLACALATGCVIVPVTMAEYDPDCQVVRHHMELQAVQVAEINRCNGQSCSVMVIAALGVTAASAIVSGSIVIIGNIAYWAERRAGCTAPPAVAG
jgi:predicted small integral membrane protein